ncbi:MAG TPA: chloramphenicol acetyltransferase [Ruminiclostridium sp.]|nr:chloramphenicol acetyltransferase [Ruminiclostridium sp.]
MKYIDMENWERKEHYHFFKDFDYPHFNICANVDITELRKYVKERDISFFIAFLYVSVRAANSVKELKYRIRGDRVVEHEKVHPSFTLMTSKNVFRFCPTDYHEDFQTFFKETSEKMKENKDAVSLEDEPGRDDLLFISSIPWVSFTSITHPINLRAVDSIPRISWGKFFEEHEKLKLPLSLQAHHALVDGAHVGEFFIRVQEILDNPQKYLEGHIRIM